MIKIINEKWPAAIDQVLDSKDKKNLANILQRKGLDIENTDSELIQISSNRDPRLKDGIIIVKFNDAGGAWSRGPRVGVWVDGQCVQDALLGTDKNYKDILASNQSWKSLLARSDIEVYRMVIDPAINQAMRDKQAARRDSQSGITPRYKTDGNMYQMDPVDGIGPKLKSRYRINNVDKSGYVVNPNKYTDMLAELQINGAQKILDDAASLYKRLANNIDKYGTEDDWMSGSYSSTMDRILRCFRDLNRVLKDYNNPDSYDYSKRYAREQVKSYLKDMRQIMKDAEKYAD